MKKFIYYICIILLSACTTYVEKKRESSVMEARVSNDCVTDTAAIITNLSSPWIYDSLQFDENENSSISFDHFPNGAFLFSFGPDHPNAPLWNTIGGYYPVDILSADSLAIRFAKHIFKAYFRIEKDSLWLTYQMSLDAYDPIKLSASKTDKFIRFGNVLTTVSHE